MLNVGEDEEMLLASQLFPVILAESNHTPHTTLIICYFGKSINSYFDNLWEPYGDINADD